jgi:hypothetical protein
MQKFSEHSRVVSPESQEAGPSLCTELSHATLRKYVRKATKSVHDMERGEYSDHNDDKAFKRKMYVAYAKNAKLREEIIRHPEHKKAYVQIDGETYKASNKHGNVKLFNKHGRKSAFNHAGIKESVLSFSELSDLVERKLYDTAFLATVNRRATKMPTVLHRKNRKMAGMYRHNTTQYVTKQVFKARSKHDPGHLTSRSKHQLTDRWRDQRVLRVKTLRKNKNVHESKSYLANRQLLHDTHAQVGRQIGRVERDPELKRIHLHRARKHAHAAGVLAKLRDVAPRKKK